MRAGLLRNRVYIQQKTASQNAAGEPVYTWTTLYTAWASIEPVRATETIAATAPVQAVTHKIGMRYRHSVTPEMRVSWTDRTQSTRLFDIESVIEPFKRGERLELMVRELV